jgi:hypothetical protein
MPVCKERKYNAGRFRQAQWPERLSQFDDIPHSQSPPWPENQSKWAEKLESRKVINMNLNEINTGPACER